MNHLPLIREGRPRRRPHLRFSRNASGQALVEACIGLALMALTWVLISHVSYMRINHVRTVMAARHAAWMMGHNAEAGGAAESFFFGRDVSYAQVAAPEALNLSAIGEGWSGAAATAQRATVSFGITMEKFDEPDVYPFGLMKARIPFMPSIVLTNYLSVKSSAAWPADVDNTWTDRGEALKGVLSEIANSVGGILKWIGSLLS